MACKICSHEKRAEIEEKLLVRSLGELPLTISDVAREFGVSEMDLQIHSMMHNTTKGPDAAESLVAAVKSKEAEYLRASIIDYQRTQMEIGAYIRAAAKPENGESKLYKLNKAAVDLYVGIGGEIRSAVDSLVRMNTAINGGDNGGVQALAELAKAIRGSAPTTTNE
jgi:hypothetical protein